MIARSPTDGRPRRRSTAYGARRAQMCASPSTPARCGVRTPLGARPPAWETVIKNAKNLGLRRLPSHYLAFNQAWCHAVAIACDLLAWLRLLAVDHHQTLSKATPDTLRRTLLHVPAVVCPGLPASRPRRHQHLSPVAAAQRRRTWPPPCLRERRTPGGSSLTSPPR